jgi:hypothetical protein
MALSRGQKLSEAKRELAEVLNPEAFLGRFNGDEESWNSLVQELQAAVAVAQKEVNLHVDLDEQRLEMQLARKWELIRN